jgi:hypothetical protein
MLSAHDMSGSSSVPYIRKYENLMKTGQETVEANNGASQALAQHHFVHA